MADGQHQYAATIGLGNDPAVRDTFGAAGRSSGPSVSGAFPNAGPARIAADIAAFEAADDPDGSGPDTNPTGMLVNGGRWLVLTDSGGNALLRGARRTRLDHRGVRHTGIVPDPPFPGPFAIPMQAGARPRWWSAPDGAYYVSELTGFPFVPGLSRIWRVVPGQAPTVYASGLTNVTDLAWHDGDLYAVQHRAGLLQGGAAGSLVKVNPGGGADDRRRGPARAVRRRAAPR